MIRKIRITNCLPAAAVIFIFLFISCARVHVRDVSYTTLVEPFKYLDTSPLENRVIVLDAGHGGVASGAVGSSGLEEKNVNLAVALRLQSYLKIAGAQVEMTREKDRDLILSDIDSLRGNDLDYRVRTSNDADADLFISLHHNSRLPIDRRFNAIETYYKMEDFYSSKDAAKYIHKHLVTNLQIPENHLRPGNYYVLRNNTRTAVLGEASYISNPNLEKKLSKPESIDIEAKSYFLGILDYFSRGVPSILSHIPERGQILQTALPDITITILEDRFGDGIDHQMITLTIDGEPVPYIYNPPSISAKPQQPLKNGQHILLVSVANLKGNHSLLYRSQFETNALPAAMFATHFPETIPPDKSTLIQIQADVLDTHYNTVRDSTIVDLKFGNNNNNQQSSYTRNGKAYFYIKQSGESNLPFSLIAGETVFNDVIHTRPLQSAHLWINFREKTKLDKSIPLIKASIEIDGTIRDYSDQEGTVFLKNYSNGSYTISGRKNGYYPGLQILTIDQNKIYSVNFNLDPMYDRVLLGKSILIDPEFGGLMPGSSGPTGLQASDENMETAWYLVEYLQKAGARAELTIQPGEDLSPYSRVRRANAAGSDLFISLRRSYNKSNNVTAFAYPTSTHGKFLGSLVLNNFRTYANQQTYGPVEAADYVLQQTGSPAIIVGLGGIADPLIENKLYGPYINRQEAYLIYTALLEYYSEDRAQWGEISGTVMTDNSHPVANALISLDETIVVQTNEMGHFQFINIEPRTYELSISAYGLQKYVETFVLNTREKILKNITLKK